MTGSTLRRLALAGTITLGLSACASGYGGSRYGGGYNPEYDRYYGDVGGYSSVPFGYAGSNFGWQGSYYYPGTGTYVYDRSGVQRQWSGQQQRYWQERARHRDDRRDNRRDDRHGDRDHNDGHRPR